MFLVGKSQPAISLCGNKSSDSDLLFQKTEIQAVSLLTHLFEEPESNDDSEFYFISIALIEGCKFTTQNESLLKNERPGTLLKSINLLLIDLPPPNTHLW